MRIGIVRHTSARAGGTETYLDTLAPALAERGHDVATLYERIPPGTAEAGPARWTTEGGIEHALRGFAGWRPDVVYVNGIRSLALERLLTTVAPAVAFAHSYLGTCISGTKTHAFPAPCHCTRRFGASCLLAYYPRRCGGLSPLTLWRDYTGQAARLELLRRYARLLVASRHMADEYARHGLAPITRVVPLPVTGPAAAPARRRGDGAWRLLYLGRLEWTKGPDVALAAAAQAASRLDRAVVLTIAGSGTQTGSLEAAAARLEQREPRLTVRFAGWVDPGRRSALLAESDLLLVPSRWPEPFGLAGPEAGLHGVPAIAFEGGGIPDWLVPGETGVIVRGPARDARAFADGLVDCLRDAARLAVMGEKGRRHAGRFTVAAHVTALEAEFAAAVRGSRGEVRA